MTRPADTFNPDTKIDASARRAAADLRQLDRHNEGRSNVHAFSDLELTALRYRLLELQARGPDEWQARKLLEVLDGYRDAAEFRAEVRDIATRIVKADLPAACQDTFDALRPDLEFKPDTIDELLPDEDPWQTIGVVESGRAIVMMRETPRYTPLEVFKTYHAGRLAEARGNLAVKLAKELLETVKAELAPLDKLGD